MQKGKYIDKVIGGIVFPLGFERVKKGSDWTYRKEVINKKNETILLEVKLYTHRFANGMLIKLWSSAMGHVAKVLRDFPGYYDNVYGEIPYNTDEEFKQVIEEIGKLLVDHGIPWLEESIEPLHDDYLKEEDYRKLYLEHDQLASAFAERMGVMVEDISLRESFDIVKKTVMDNAEKSFQDMIPSFLEMSAFLAKVAGNTRKYEWRLEEYFKQLRCSLYVYNLAGVPEENVMVMHTIIFFWLKRGEGLVRSLIDMFKLPPDGYVPEQ